MNKAELVDAVAEKVSATKKDIDMTLTAILDIIAEQVAGGEKVTLVGFGTFEPRQRQGRVGRNPKTGEAINIPAQVVPGFSAGKAFKERVNA
jgi:DNA-binding protein HU-beta